MIPSALFRQLKYLQYKTEKLTEPSHVKRVFFFRIVLNIHCYNLLRLTKPGYEYSNTCLARHYLKYSITAQHVGIVHNHPFSTMKNNV